jgi:hypothetical protein
MLPVACALRGLPISAPERYDIAVVWLHRRPVAQASPVTRRRMVYGDVLTRLMTVGAPLASDAIELVSPEEPGLDPERIATDTSTVIAAGAVDVRGRSVLVDVEERSGASVAVFVRAPLPPHQVDIDRFEAVLAAFRRSGIADLVTDPTDAVLGKAFEDCPHFWDPKEFLTRTFLDRALESDEVFPTMWWHDDPSAGVDEMAGLLKLLGVGKRFPRKRLIVDARRALDHSEDEDACSQE